LFKNITLLALRCLQSFFILSLASAAFAVDSTPGGDSQILRFEISSYVVDGATLLTATEIQEAVAPFVGKDKDFSDVQRALEAVEAAYAKHGYTAVQVALPEQELEKGRVRFRVVESRFGNVTVRGQKYFSEASARNALPSLRQGDAPRSRKIASELNLANENPARQLNVVLKAGKKEDQVDADILVADKNPSTWGMSFDNSGTTETGHTRLGLSYSNANVLNADHVGSMQLQVSPQQMSRVRVFGAGYRIPLYALGDSVEFFGGYSNVNSVVGGLANFQGGGQLLNVRYNQTLDRIASFDPHLYYGFDWRNFKRIEQTRPSSAVLYNEITVTPFSLGYAAKGKSERSTTSFDFNLSANVPKMSKGKKADFAAYDPLGMLLPDANYRIVHYDASHVQTVGNDWQARGALTGQWSRNVLILGEQIRLGGMNGVRGFSEGSEAGESGMHGTLEVYSPEMDSGGIKNRALVFFDGGSVHSHSGVRSSITSAGFGLRTSWEQFSFRMDAGRIGKAGLDPLQKSGDWHIHAALSAMF
jgi:hemolysin activation/secretion protein